VARNTFSVKFTADGLSDVLKASKKVSRSYVDWLESAEKAIEETNRAAEEFADDQDKLIDLNKQREKAARDANRAITASYRELGIRSSRSIQEAKDKAISAYKALEKSGVASTEDLERAAVSLDRKLKSLDGQLENVGDEARDASGGFTILKGSIAGVIANLATGVIQRGVEGLFNLGRSAIATRAEMSKLRDQLELLEGSESGGVAAFDKISEFAKTTPFELNEVTQAYVKLGNRGIKPTNEQLTKLGDLALSQGKSLDQLVEAVLDAQTGENERLKEFGIRGAKSGDQVTFAFKGVEKQVQLTEEAVLDALVSFGEVEGVAGSIEKAGDRLDGVGSNIADSFTRIQDTIGGIFEPLLVSGGKFLVEVLSPISDPKIWEPLTQAFQTVIETVSDIAPNVKSIQDLVSSSLKSAIQSIANILQIVSKLVAENRDRFVEIGATLQGAITQSFGTLLSQAANFTERLRDNPRLIDEMAQRLGGLLKDLQSVLKLAAQLAKFISSITVGIAKANKATGGWLAKIVLVGAAIAKIVGVIAAIIGSVAKISAAVGGVTAVVGGVAAAWTSVVGAVTAVIAVIGGVAAAIGGVIAGILSIPVIVAGVVAAAIAAAAFAIYKFRDEIVAALTAAWNAIASAFTSAWNAMIDAAASTWRGYIADVQRGWDAAVQVIQAKWEALVRFFLEGWRRFNEAAAEALGFADKAIKGLISPMKSIFDLGKDIGKSIKAWANPLKKAGDLLKGFKDGFIKILGLSEDVGTDVGKKLESNVGATGGPLLPAPAGSFAPKSFPITSHFGPRNGRLHAGTDYGTPQGTPLGNIFGAGVITRAGFGAGGYGGLIELTLPSGEVYRFGHMSDIRVGVGQRVPAGALLGLTGGAPGTVGAGRSTGPHLHLEYYPRGLDGGAVDFVGTGRGGPTVPKGAFPFNPHVCGPDCKIHGSGRRKKKGRGGPTATKKKAKKKDTELTIGGTKFTIINSTGQSERFDIESRMENAKSKLDRALERLGVKSQDDSIERQVRDEYKSIINDLKDAETQYKLIIQVKKELKEATEEENEALEKIAETRSKISDLQDDEIAKAKELRSLQQTLTRAENLESLAGLESEIEARRIDQAVNSGAINIFDADRLSIQRRIVEENARFARQLAELKLERAEAPNQETAEYLDQLIDKYAELNKVTLEGLTGELDQVAEAQKEATRVLPSATELASTITGSLRAIPDLITDVVTGTKSFGEAVLGVLSSIAKRLADLFLDKAFQAFEGVLGGLFGGSKKQGSGILGSLVGAGIGAITGGSGGGSTSALNFDSAPIFANRGAVLPGYGGGDRRLTFLEDGEAVLRKELVREISPERIMRANQAISPAALLSAEAMMGLNVAAVHSGGNSSISRSTTNDIDIHYHGMGQNQMRPTQRQTSNDLTANLQRYSRG
jgi:murein DD-endopeptidase MepM/ murein hydrolase activator NlpD